MTPAVLVAYCKMLKEKAPHTIRTRKDYDERCGEILNLMIANRTKAKSEYLDLLVTLVEGYEREHIKLPQVTPLMVSHELMEARAMKQSELTRIVGSSGTASEIFNGKRGISAVFAKTLASHFNVDFSLFL